MTADAHGSLKSEFVRDSLRITWRFFLLIAVFSMIVYLDQRLLGSAAMNLITESSARVIVFVFHVFGVEAASSGNWVTYRDITFIVTPECTGYEVLELFAAAVIATPLPWAFRLRGLAMGLSTLLLINFARMMSLVIFSVRWPEFHDLGHLYTWPVIVITIALGLWLAWVNDAYDRLDAAH